MSDNPWDEMASDPAIRSIAKLAVSATQVTPLDEAELYAWVVPDGHKVVTNDQRWRSGQPHRAYGEATFHDRASFIDYVIRFSRDADAEPYHSAALFANIDSQTVTAILNYHADPGAAGWGDWRAKYTLKQTAAWQAWMSIAGTLQSQENFAYFLQQHVGDVTDPPGGDLLTIAQDLRYHKNTQFEKTIDLQDGTVQMLFNETVTSSESRSGTLQMPQTITVILTPFEGGEPRALTGWLRYRVAEGRASFMVDFGDEVKRLVELLFAEYVAAIQAATGITVWHGVAPTPVPVRTD